MRLLQKNKSHFGRFLRALLDVRQRIDIILLYLPLEKPQWKYCFQFGTLHLKTDGDNPEESSRMGNF